MQKGSLPVLVKCLILSFIGNDDKCLDDFLFFVIGIKRSSWIGAAKSFNLLWKLHDLEVKKFLTMNSGRLVEGIFCLHFLHHRETRTFFTFLQILRGGRLVTEWHLAKTVKCSVPCYLATDDVSREYQWQFLYAFTCNSPPLTINGRTVSSSLFSFSHALGLHSSQLLPQFSFWEAVVTSSML